MNEPPSDRLLALVDSNDLAFLEQVRTASPRVEVVTRREFEERADELLPLLAIVYGGLSPEQIARAPKLRWLQTMGAGVEGLVRAPEVQNHPFVITNASGIHAEPITEHMFGMLLMVTRHLYEAREQQTTKKWRGGYDFGANVTLLAGKTLGVLGVGAIGGHSAHVGKAFGMRVVGLRRGAEPHPDVETMYTPEQRLAFFAASNVVMNSLPLTDDTRGFVGASELAALPKGAIVINTGRGATIETDALLAALESGHLGAALLDVTDPEPLPPDHPLWTAPNVFITPHYSGSHPTYNERAGRIFLDNLRRFLNNEPLVNVVDKQEGY